MRFGLLVLIVIALGSFIFWKDIRGVVKGNRATHGNESNAEGKASSEGITIEEKWDMPAILKEVSGIAYMDEDRFACIQDEQGVIYIYNRADNKVEKEIAFAEPGDFEDIALVGQTAWVARADGKLFEIDIAKKEASARPYSTPLTVKHDVEGLVYDKAGNRLLLAIKGEEPGGNAYKGIYGFDLATKILAKEPVYRIDLENKMFTAEKGKKNRSIKPSAIGIHPSTGDIYITDGPQSRLLIMDSKGGVKDFLTLGKSFEQPEGLSFSPQGQLYISNEGNKEPGNILQVTLR